MSLHASGCRIPTRVGRGADGTVCACRRPRPRLKNQCSQKKTHEKKSSRGFRLGPSLLRRFGVWRASELRRVQSRFFPASEFFLVRPERLIRAERPVAPREDGRVRPREGFVVEVVVHGASPERNKVGRVERQIVPRVVLDCFEQTHGEPRP